MGMLVQLLWQIFLGLVAVYCACAIFLRAPDVPIPTTPKLAHVEGLPEDDGDDDDSD
jgi:hypothetical protein